MSGPYISAASRGATAVFNVEGGDNRVSPEAGDSADGSVTVARKASLVLTVEVEGKAAHAGSPLDGSSAIDSLALKIVRASPAVACLRFMTAVSALFIHELQLSSSHTIPARRTFAN